MNIRIDSSSVRIRMMVSDVARLATEGFLELRLCFAPGAGAAFACRIESASVAEPVARYIEECLLVELPDSFVTEWLVNDEIGTKVRCGSITVSVEKDLRRVKPWRVDAEDSERYPNPRAGRIIPV